MDPDELRHSRRELTAITTVEAAIVINPSRLDADDLGNTLADLVADNVRQIKFILENVEGVGTGAAEFEALLRGTISRWSPHFDDVRFSDPNVTRCRLPEKSFPSITLDTGYVYACCVQVGAPPAVTGLSPQAPTTDWRKIRDRLVDVVTASMAVPLGTLPCGAYYGACPLALTRAS
jgi:hypothetical protein